MYTLRLVVGTNFRDYGFGGYNFSDSEPGNKNTTRGWLKESFQMPFSGQTSMTEKRSF